MNIFKKISLTGLFMALLFLQLPSGQEESGFLGDLMRVKNGRSRAVTSSSPNLNSNLDRLTYISPGETYTIADIQGPGIINHIWLTFNEARANWLEAGGSAHPGEIVLRMYWDDGSSPAVEAPLGDFFGAGFGGRREVRSLPVTVEGGDGYNCYWQMPFFTRAVITATNEGEKNVRSFYYHIDYTEVDTLPQDTAYFCAQYRQEFPQSLGRDYVILDAEGQGHYVGTVMSVRSRSPSWFGEGDVRIYIDGDTSPTIQGTGTEDYFLCAWGLNECLFPYFGCTFMSGDLNDLGARYTLYRWHVADPIRFNHSFRFEIEHTGWVTGDETTTGTVESHVEREDDMATVAFWYQVGQPRQFTAIPPLRNRAFPNLDRVVEGKAMLPTIRHSPGTAELQPGYEWSGDGQIFFKPESTEAALELDFAVDVEEYRGLVLRMTSSYDYGSYRIYLDGRNIAEIKDDPSLGQVDFYSPAIEVKDIYLGSFILSRGRHTLRFESVEQNPQSGGNNLGIDSVRFRQRWNRRRPPLRRP